MLEAVAIHPPYRAEDCRAPSGKGGGSGGGVGYQMIGRVRKVVSTLPFLFLSLRELIRGHEMERTRENL